MALSARIVGVVPDVRFDGSLTVTAEYFDDAAPSTTLYVHTFDWPVGITSAAARNEVVTVGQQLAARIAKAATQAAKWVGTVIAIPGT